MKVTWIFLLSCCAVCSYAQPADVDSLLRTIGKKDQAVREAFIRAYTTGVSGDTLLAVSEKMKAVDAENQRAVFGILETTGWPAGLSRPANNAIFLVIDHAGQPDREKYLPLLAQKADEGVVDRGQYATLFDRVRMDRGLPQVYGTQSVMFADRETGDDKCYLWPVEQPDRVDSLRMSAGLIPLGEYLELLEKTYGKPVVWERELTVSRLNEIRHAREKSNEPNDTDSTSAGRGGDSVHL